jgi:hypothetical protein
MRGAGAVTHFILLSSPFWVEPKHLADPGPSDYTHEKALSSTRVIPQTGLWWQILGSSSALPAKHIYDNGSTCSQPSLI